jgi:hypothetical protein
MSGTVCFLDHGKLSGPVFSDGYPVECNTHQGKERYT